MHILTGLAIAALTRKGVRGEGRRAPSLVPLLRSGPVRTEHYVPGRIRFRVPSLTDDEQGRALLEAKLPSLEGVESVRVSATTGSVLITYREADVQPELLFAAVVRLAGLEEQMKRPPQSLVTRELRSALDGLNRAVHDRTGGLLDLWSALLIVMAGVGVKKLFTEGAAALPGGFTMLYWALAPLAGVSPE